MSTLSSMMRKASSRLSLHVRIGNKSLVSEGVSSRTNGGKLLVEPSSAILLLLLKKVVSSCSWRRCWFALVDVPWWGCGPAVLKGEGVGEVMMMIVACEWYYRMFLFMCDV